MQSQLIQATVSQQILKPVAEVFEAIVQPEQMTQYFISDASGEMEAGKTITWTFADAVVSVDVLVESVMPAKQIVFKWPASGDSSTVTINFEQTGKSETKVTVTETGWEMDESGVQRALQQTQGWMHMLLCLKAYIEFGINLRKGNSE